MLAALAVFICYMARVIFWSLFTMLTPVAAAGGLTALLVTRVFMGIGEGIIFPSIYAMFGRWVPETERSRGIGTLFSTFPLGSVFALLATSWIVMHYGWEVSFYAFGAVGFVWLIFWYRYAATTPESHPKISAQELILINGDGLPSSGSPAPPLKTLLSSRAVWAIVVGHFCANWVAMCCLPRSPPIFFKVLALTSLLLACPLCFLHFSRSWR